MAKQKNPLKWLLGKLGPTQIRVALVQFLFSIGLFCIALGISSYSILVSIYGVSIMPSWLLNMLPFMLAASFWLAGIAIIFGVGFTIWYIVGEPRDPTTHDIREIKSLLKKIDKKISK